MKSLNCPSPLRPGDKVALTAPSSPVPEEKLAAAAASVADLGLVPEIMDSCRMSHGYLAGDDRQRAEDLNSAFARSDIRGVFCLTGGYGAMRILPLLDYQTIRSNMKLFIGYSDITALHTAINRHCGFMTFHGPMPTTDYRTLDPFSLASLRKALFTPCGISDLKNPSGETMEIMNREALKGKTYVTGILTGGNLDLLAGTLGSPYEIITDNRILFIEDVDREPWEIDSMLTSLSLAGKFRRCRAVLFGTFTDCGTDMEKTLEIRDIIREVVLPCGRPVFLNMRAGHIYPQSTLPMGGNVIIDAEKCADTPFL